MSENSQDIAKNIRTEEGENKTEPAASASSLNRATRDVKSDPERQWIVCIGNDEIKKEKLEKNCEKCGRTTTRKNHKCKIRCKICDKKLNSKRCLIYHLQSFHRAEPDFKYFECDFCGVRYLRKLSIIKHLKLNHKAGKTEEFQCDYDGKVFTSKLKLYAHIIYCRRASSTCKICGKNLRNLKAHMESIHPVENITVACKVCNKILKNKYSLARHLQTHNKQFECRVCRQKFSLSFQLKAHLKTHENPQIFNCKICYKNFSSRSNLKTHEKTHDKDRKKLHQCELCDYATANKQDLKRHLNVHDKNRIKNLRCSKCDYKTDNKSSLKTHIYNHNPYSARFSCPYCDFTSKSMSNLNMHIRIHSVRVKDQKCPHCNYATDNKTNLKDHIKTHGKEIVLKKFKCSSSQKAR
jgi:KRAB domain-containing zinc finger protein